jgi:hypothetical protein
MRVEEAITALATSQAAAGPADDQAVRTFIEACDRADRDVREQQRVRDIADLVDAEDALYAQAVAALDRSDREVALPLLRRCAKAGVGESAWLLGGVLETAGNIPEATFWYGHAAGEGDSRAQGRLAELLAAPSTAQDGWDLEALLSGERAWLPGGMQPVAGSLAALRAVPIRAELAGEAAATTMFREIMAAGQGEPDRPGEAGDGHTLILSVRAEHDGPNVVTRPRHAHRRPPRRGRWKSKALVGAAAVMVVGCAALAGAFSGTGGHPGPSPDTASAAPQASHTGSIGLEGNATKEPTYPTPGYSGSRQSGNGRGTQSSASVLCHQYLAFLMRPESPSEWASEGDTFYQLSELAGGSQRIADYCVGL